MNRVRVISSNLKSVGYDNETATLEIEFLNSGVYRYFGVPAETHARLMISASKGKFFDQHIKPRFRYQKAGG